MSEAAVESAAEQEVPGTIYLHVPVAFLTKVLNGELLSAGIEWTDAPTDIKVVAVEQSIEEREYGICRLFVSSLAFPARTKFEKGFQKGLGYQWGTAKGLRAKGIKELPQGGRWLRKIVVPGQ